MSLTVSNNNVPVPAGSDDHRLPMLLDFHSPTAALTV